MEAALEGTVALVTGASSGIGAATAAALADHGAAVALAARRRDRLEALAAEIRGRGGTALVLECDVTDQDQRGAAPGADARRELLQPVPAPRRQGHGRTVIGQRCGRGRADTARRPRH